MGNNISQHNNAIPTQRKWLCNTTMTETGDAAESIQITFIEKITYIIRYLASFTMHTFLVATFNIKFNEKIAYDISSTYN